MAVPTPLTPEFAVSTQITAADFPNLAAAGYKTIINNRPDGEEAGQLTAAAARQLAEQNGLNYVHIPVTMSDLTATTIAQFETALTENPGPVLAHCKSGTRSCILWAIATARQPTTSLADLLSLTAQQGYNLERLRPLIEQYAQPE